MLKIAFIPLRRRPPRRWRGWMNVKKGLLRGMLLDGQAIHSVRGITPPLVLRSKTGGVNLGTTGLPVGCSIIFILVFVFISACAFAETSIKAEVDRKVITTDEVLTYKIIIVSTEKQIPRPQQPPQFEGFNVVSQAQSTSVNFSASGVKNAVVFAYVLAPTKTGEIEIKPSVLKMNNQAYSTDAFKIQVKQGSSKSQPKLKPKQRPSLPLGVSPGQEETTL